MLLVLLFAMWAVSAAAANAVVQHAKHPEGLSLLRKARLEGKGDQRAYVAELPSGRKAKLTVNPRLQEQMQRERKLARVEKTRLKPPTS